MTQKKRPKRYVVTQTSCTFEDQDKPIDAKTMYQPETSTSWTTGGDTGQVDQLETRVGHDQDSEGYKNKLDKRTGEARDFEAISE